MKTRKLTSLVLVVALLCSMAVFSIPTATTAAAATVDAAPTGASSFYNMNKYSDQVYNGTDLGFTYTPSATTWKVWSPAATKVQLKLYKTGTDRENGAGVIGTYDLTKGSQSVWSVQLNGDYKNIYYTYLVTAANTQGKVVTNETQDVYSKALGANGDRSMVVDLESTNPDGWADDKHVVFQNKTEANVWELHIRDFSADPDSGVSEKNRGAYLAFTEGGTTYKNQGTFSTCMDYLVKNNINTVQLMPFADFDGVDEIYGASEKDRNWGYNPKNYNVPDGSYSSNPYDGNVRINEVKQMIQALHDRGISVVMDVVYNHTAGADGSCFTKTVPGYYYRMMSAKAYFNGSGQGNELATENAMVRNYIVQSMKYWVDEYHIDGFRFDLMGCIDIGTLSAVRTAINNMYTDGTGQKILIYGEPWNAGESGCTNAPFEDADKRTSNSTSWPAGVGAFSAAFRKAASNVSGEKKGASQGWVGGNSGLNGGHATVFSGIKASLYDYNDASKTINYLECHDNLTLWDKLVGAYTITGEGKKSQTSATNVNSTSDSYINKLKLGGMLLMTSQGITFMNSGTEFARTKQGQGNSYNSPDSINMLDWKRVSTYKTSVDYYKGLRQINEVYSAFNGDSTSVRNTITGLSNNSGTFIGYTIQNNVSGEWGKVAVLMNSGSSAVNASVPGNWVVVANASQAGVKSLGTASGSYSVPAFSGAILVEQSSFKDFSDKFTYGTLTTNHYVGSELVKTTTAKYRIGTTYHALKDASLLVNNKVTSTEGTPSGKFTGDTTVSYHYESNGKTMGTLTVKYLDASGKSVTPDMTYTLEQGDKYSIPVCAVQGYQLDTDKYPAGSTGTFSGDKTITFKYNPLASQQTIIHYKLNTSLIGTAGAVMCYAYTDDGDEPLGDWNDTLGQGLGNMKADSTLGSGWYTVTIPVAACRVLFHRSNSSGQEPAQNEPGYPVAGECTIQNGVITYNTTITMSYINIDTGEKLRDDISATQKKLSTDQYSTSSISGLGTLVETPANAQGFCQPGVINVVYLYKVGGEEPTEPPTTPTTPTDPTTPTTPTEPSTPTTPTIPANILGDADCDGAVTINDVTYIQLYLVDLVSFGKDNEINADVDASGKVTIKDANFIQRYKAAMVIEYKIGEPVVIVTPTTPTTPTTVTTPTQPTNPDDPFNPFGPDDPTDPTSPTEPQPGQTMTIILSNNRGWGDTIYCYCWDDEENKILGDWPGTAMTYYDTNDFGEKRYTVEVPVGTYIIFNDGNDQTDDFFFDGTYNGYYPSEEKNELGRHICVGYNADF